MGSQGLECRIGPGEAGFLTVRVLAPATLPDCDTQADKGRVQVFQRFS